MPSQRMRKRRLARRVPHAKEPRRNGIHLARIELEEFAVPVDQHHGLQRLLGQRIVPHGVVRKVVEHLECQEEARLWHERVPCEYAAVHDLHPVGVARVQGRGRQVRGLRAGQLGADLDDAETRARVDGRISRAYVIEDVEHQRAVARAQLVDEQVVVRVVRQQVVLHQVARDGLAVVRTEELGWRVPELPRRIGMLGVQSILECGVARAEGGVEVGLAAQAIKVEGLARAEDDSLLRKVAVVGIVKAV